MNTKTLGQTTLASGRTVYTVGVYLEAEGHWLTTVVFKNKLLAWMFHVLLNASLTHMGSRYV